MSDTTNTIADDIEQSVKGKDGYVNLSHVYDQLRTLQRQESPTAFTQDLQQINDKLHQDGVLPQLTITGIDDQGHFNITNRDGSGGTVTRDGINTRDFLPSSNPGAEAQSRHADGHANGQGTSGDPLTPQPVHRTGIPF